VRAYPRPKPRDGAAVRVGRLDALKEEVRDERGGRLVTDALGDLRIGWRTLSADAGAGEVLISTELWRQRFGGSADRPGAPRVAIVSETFARRHFPGGDAFGKRFKSGGWNPKQPWITIVGVAGDVPYERGVRGGKHPTVYLPNAQNFGVQSPYVVLKAASSLQQLVPAVRQAVLGVDARVPLRDVVAMTDRLYQSAAEPRLRSLLFASLAGVALILAITGIYGVLAYHVAQRRRETAIRRALGARSSQVVGEVVAAGLRVTAAGILLGVIGAVALTRSLSGVLYDVRPMDPGVLAAAAAVLLTAALAACAIPAIRAVRMDPLTILREE
jgi:putative ABC transport system permease protein